jgi:hypothetical protein
MMSVSSSSSVGQTTEFAAIFHPIQTIRCSGQPVFRHQWARDVACLLDVDDDVVSWSCQPTFRRADDSAYRPDLLVCRHDGSYIVDAGPTDISQYDADAIARMNGLKYERIERVQDQVMRIKNAKDLLRYARFEVALADRIRILAILEETGSLSVSECLTVFKETKPIAALASLTLHRFIMMDLDEIITPETKVRRFLR